MDHNEQHSLPENLAVDSPDDLVVVEIVPPKPYGLWATIGWSVLLMIVFVFVQTTVVVAFVISRGLEKSQAEIEEYALTLQENGLVISIMTLLTAPVCWGCVAFLSRLRGWKVRDYLALRPLRRRSVVISTLAFALFVIITDSTAYLFDHEIVSDFMVNVYASCPWPALLFLALVVGAPVGEELLFRGFAFRGLAASLGPAGAIFLTSFAWALIHVQYDLFGIMYWRLMFGFSAPRGGFP